MMNPFSWLQMTNMISYQGLVRTFPSYHLTPPFVGGIYVPHCCSYLNSVLLLLPCFPQSVAGILTADIARRFRCHPP
ncbi:hypothetical protein ACK3YX_20395, partial [Aeromonas caviae]